MNIEEQVIPDTLEEFPIPCFAPITNCTNLATMRILFEDCCRTKRPAPICNKCYELYAMSGMVQRDGRPYGYCRNCAVDVYCVKIYDL